MAEKFNLKAKCLRYRIFLQVIVASVLIFGLMKYVTPVISTIVHSRQDTIIEIKDNADELNIEEDQKDENNDEPQEDTEKDEESTKKNEPPDEFKGFFKDEIEEIRKERQKNVTKQKQKSEQKEKTTEQPPVYRSLPFGDPSKSWKERVDDLVSRLTLDEVVEQAQAAYGKFTPAVERLGVKPYIWSAECIHGLHNTLSTSFPQSIGLAATFSTELMYKVSEAISNEARAYWNRQTKANLFQMMLGLTCFSPTINILRHPMWGRNQETYGEDPFLTGLMAEAYIKGLQGNHKRYIRAGAACKHFVAHSGPEQYKQKFDAVVSEGDLRMTYLPAFQACVKAGAVGVMCSYNKLNGVPMCANKDMLTGMLRDLWGFKGFVVTDAGAIDYMLIDHKYGITKSDVAAKALLAGVNLGLSTKKLGSQEYLKTALEKKIITEKQVRDSVKPLLMTRMRLGEFDPPEMNPYSAVNFSIVQSTAHRALASQVAASSFVLLKNNNNILPLKTVGTKTNIVVLGPVAVVAKPLYGAYGPNLHHLYTQRAIKGLQKLSQDVGFEEGCGGLACPFYEKEVLQPFTEKAELIIVTLVGVTESEFKDRSSFSPPGKYVELIKLLGEWSKAPVVLLVFSGSPVDLTWAQEAKHIAAIVHCSLPGQASGDALFNMLTAETPDGVPAGRLPFSWPKTVENITSITDYHMEGRTYRYLNDEPLYPFGYGLSYTTFQYVGLSVEPKLGFDITQTLEVKVSVKNTGSFSADEVVQVYAVWPKVTVPSQPKIQLVAFKRIRIEASMKKKVTFSIPGDRFMVWIDKKTGFKLIPAKMKLYVGGQQPNQKVNIGSNVLETQFQVVDRKS